MNFKWLRFFNSADYIKKLEGVIDEYEYKKQLNSIELSVKDETIETQRRTILRLEREISILKSKPPEPKIASNIDISDPIFQKMIKAGRAAMVKKAHPDHGGSREEFEKVEKAFEMLKGLKIQQQEKPYRSGLSDLNEADMARRQYYASMAASQNNFGRYGQTHTNWPFNF